MENIIISTIEEAELTGFMLPLVTVYHNPEDFPHKAVARIFNVDKPTKYIMVADSVEELENRLSEAGLYRLERRAEDVPAIVSVWL